MDRDPKTGKFVRRNKAALGNRGNRQPKWGNENALKHGLYARTFCYVRNGDLILCNRKHIVIFRPDQFELYPDGRFALSDEIDVEPLKEMGFNILEWVEND